MDFYKKCLFFIFIFSSLRSEGYLKEGSKCVGFCSIPDQQCLLMGLNTGELLQVGIGA